jgi:hypothetical protein
MLWLVLVFSILSVVFRFWAFAAAAWIGLKILFWVFLVLLNLSLIGTIFRSPVP